MISESGEEMVGEIIGTGLTLDKSPKISQTIKNRIIFEDNYDDQ